MLRPDAININAVERVAADIGELISDSGSSPLFNLSTAAAEAPGNAPAYEMTESFAVWAINYDELMAAEKYPEVASLPKPINRWHHQIRQDGKVTGYARSASADADALSLREFVDSALARQVDRAMSLLEEFEATDPAFQQTDWTVRLLVVPAYQVYSFLLVDEKCEKNLVLLIHAPPQLDSIPRKKLISLESFVMALRQAKPAAGLGAPDSDQELT
jgi:hypothetical protein